LPTKLKSDGEPERFDRQSSSKQASVSRHSSQALLPDTEPGNEKNRDLMRQQKLLRKYSHPRTVTETAWMRNKAHAYEPNAQQYVRSCARSPSPTNSRNHSLARWLIARWLNRPLSGKDGTQGESRAKCQHP
jgi:hypothetical protein